MLVESRRASIHCGDSCRCASCSDHDQSRAAYIKLVASPQFGLLRWYHKAMESHVPLISKTLKYPDILILYFLLAEVAEGGGNLTLDSWSRIAALYKQLAGHRKPEVQEK